MWWVILIVCFMLDSKQNGYKYMWIVIALGCLTTCFETVISSALERDRTQILKELTTCITNSSTNLSNLVGNPTVKK